MIQSLRNCMHCGAQRPASDSDRQSEPGSSAMAISFFTASLVAIGVAVFFAQQANQPPASLATFEEVRCSLYRLTYHWRILPGILSMPVATWLVESSTLMSPKSWIRIDAGTDVATNQEAILQGIKSKLSSAGGSLKLSLRILFLTVCVVCCSPAKGSWQSTTGMCCSDVWSCRSCWGIAKVA